MLCGLKDVLVSIKFLKSILLPGSKHSIARSKLPLP